MRWTVEAVISEIQTSLPNKKRPILIAVDGRCASGKTTLAENLRNRCDCNVIHMDDFFPRPEQRTAERMAQPGGNVDYERFLTEVMEPLKKDIAFSYRPYNCKTQRLDEPIQIVPKPFCIIEGAYACHPHIIKAYDFKIFLTVDKEEQLRRIERRNGEAGKKDFIDKWIPKEELYFSVYHIEETCDLVITKLLT